MDGGVGDVQGFGDLAEGLAGLAEFVGVEDSAASLWGGGHCWWNSCSGCESSTGVEGVALVRREKSSMTERGETRSPLPPLCGGRCPRGTEGGSRSHEASTEPPSACGISPRGAGGEGIRAASSPAEWRERGAGRADSVGRSWDSVGHSLWPTGERGDPGGIFTRRVAGEGSGGRPIPGFRRPILGFGRPLLVADRGERGSGRHLHPQSGGRGERGGRSPDSVGRSWDSVGRSWDSVGHSLWPTGAA